MRLGVAAPFLANLDADTRSAFEGALAKLRAAGVTVLEVQLPELMALIEKLRAILASDTLLMQIVVDELDVTFADVASNTPEEGLGDTGALAQAIQRLPEGQGG